jgi:oligopeptide transport system permease protein
MSGGAQEAMTFTEPVVTAGPSGRQWRALLRRPTFVAPAAVIVVMVAIAVVPGAFAGWFGHGDPRVCDLKYSSLGPRGGHPFGFDIQGCDLYSNVIYGARNSLLIGVLVTAGALAVAVTLGTLAAYVGGIVDTLISRLMDIFFGFPALVGMIVVLQMLGERDVISVVLVLMLFVWPSYARVMRGSALGVINLEYVQASRTVGASHARIIVSHVIPNSVAPVAVLATLGIAATIAAEAALTFLGVGLETPSISWGVQLNVAQEFFATDPHLLIFPSLFLAVTVLGFVAIGDALRDHFDPRQRGVSR